MTDKRTIAEVLENSSAVVGYLWVTFTDVQGYNLTIAEIMDIAVAPEYRRRGIGLRMLKHIEKLTKQRGATLLRSGTGIENVASQKLHEKLGFWPYRIHYEKVVQ
jgi:ribosomal protein S18 acetylase RimI-like enzyme